MTAPVRTPIPSPFRSAPPEFRYFINPFTDEMVSALGAKPRFADLGVSIIDLTHRTRDPKRPGFLTATGWNWNSQRFIASMAKICAMFASFHLRENLTTALDTSAETEAKKAVADVTATWKPLVERAVPAGRPDFPRITDIFKVGGTPGAWRLTFTNAYAANLDAMISHSSNSASKFCIDRLGFQYINGALAAEGLYVPGKGGLWLGGNFAGNNWLKEPVSKLTHMGGTAQMVGNFLTQIENNALVNRQASIDMRALLSKAGTWAGEGLTQAKPSRPVVSIYGKVGLMGTAHDCAVVERSTAGKGIRYACVILTAPNPQVIRDLVVALDDYVIASN